jgi:hypothetical protein
MLVFVIASAVVELVETTSEAILQSVTAEARIDVSLDNFCRIASLIRSKILAFQAQNFFSHSLAMTN